MSASRPDDSIVLEAGANDVLLGRGNAVNFREGNVRFRKLAQSKALRYATCSNKLEKDRIAESIISEIRSIGGSFLRPISARNDKGEHLSAWEQVPKDVALTKAKQTLRDCAAAIRRETAMRSTTPSPPSLHPSLLLRGVLPHPQSLGRAASNLLQSSMPSIHSLPTRGQTLGTDTRTSMLSRPMSVQGGNDSPTSQPYDALSSQLLDDQQSRLLQSLQHRQQSEESPLAFGAANTEGRKQQDVPNSTATSDLRRVREHMLIEQYYRDQAAAEAQQRTIWNQLSRQPRARYDAAFLQPPGVDLSLNRLIEAQRDLNVLELEAMLSRSDVEGLRVPQETLERLARDRVVAEAKVQERTTSFDSQQEKSQGSSDHSTNSTNRPLKKRKGLPKQGSD